MDNELNLNGEPEIVSQEQCQKDEEGQEVFIEIAEVLKNLKEAEDKAKENLDRYQRTLAEFDNFRKRTIKERAASYDDGAAAIITSLLPVIDNFERAISSCKEEDRQTSLFAGIELIYKQLTDFMQANNIKAVESVGEPFNPELHSAIAHVDDDKYGENQVVEDMQKGYMYKDRVLRHSMVKVAN